MNFTRSNPNVTARRSGDGGDGSAGDGDDDDDDDDDDPDEVQLDDGDDGDDFPPSGKEFPRQIPACRRAFLSLWFSAP